MDFILHSIDPANGSGNGSGGWRRGCPALVRQGAASSVPRFIARPGHCQREKDRHAFNPQPRGGTGSRFGRVEKTAERRGWRLLRKPEPGTNLVFRNIL